MGIVQRHPKAPKYSSCPVTAMVYAKKRGVRGADSDDRRSFSRPLWATERRLLPTGRGDRRVL